MLMESPGEHLKRERELRGYTLRKVFETTRVPLKFLEAIEADDFDNLPQPTFVKGFIRAYCKFLGIDDNDSVLRYDLYLREKSGKSYELTPLPNAADKRPQSLPAHYTKWLVLGLVSIGLITVIIYTVTRKNEPLQQPVKHEPTLAAEQPKADPALVALSEKTTPPPKTNTPVTLQPKQHVSVPLTSAQARLTEPQTSVPSQVIASQPPATAPEKRYETSAGEPLTSKPTGKSAHSLHVKATEDTWIKIRIDDAAQPLDVLLRTGESVSWKADNTFSIIVGNAGGVTLSLDGSPLGPLGKSGEVVSLKIPQQTKTLSEAQPAASQPAIAEKPKD